MGIYLVLSPIENIVELWKQPLSNAELLPPAKPKLRIETGIGNIFTLATFPHPQQWTIKRRILAV